MKKKILILVSIILFLIAGLLIAPNLIDWNEYKSQVADGFESATGNKIDIKGELSFKLLPSPALSASAVSLANVSWGGAENFLELKSLDIRLELFPLLNGNYKVTSLLLDGGKINLEKNAAGDANWKQLFAGGEKKPTRWQRRQWTRPGRPGCHAAHLEAHLGSRSCVPSRSGH